MTKTLITVVTRNNPVLLQNLINSIDKNDAGTPFDLVIADNTSDNVRQLKLLELLSKRFTVQVCENDRAETSYNTVSSTRLKDYDYFFFMHEDTYAYKPNWLKVYIDRAQSNYFEQEIKGTHLIRYPVGRVSGCSQPWRDFEKCKGFPLPSFFLKACLQHLNKDNADNIWIYKYSDQERVLYTKKCLEEDGMFYLKYWKELEQTNNDLFTRMKNCLDQHLQYYDEGMGPKDKYPPGQTWCKFMLLTEFLNSVFPLMNGFRTVGLEGDGYLEQIDGFDKPFGMNYICHFGSPHTKKWLGTKFGCSGDDIHKKLYANDFSFILKCNKLIEEYYK